MFRKLNEELSLEMFIENRIKYIINEKHENRKLSNVKLINREKDKILKSKWSFQV